MLGHQLRTHKKSTLNYINLQFYHRLINKGIKILIKAIKATQDPTHTDTH